jgi:DNA-binding LacI/PurR family transcriptional regulator
MSEGHPAVEAVLARGLPTLIVDEPRVPGVPFLGIADREGARLAAAHVVERGHRRIGVVAARLQADGFEGDVTPERLAGATFSIERDRLAGFGEALEAAGIDWPRVPIVESHNDQPSGEAAARRLLEAPEPPDALLCTTDQLALGALRAAARLGRAVAVTGFDDVPEAEAAGLTTVRQPLVGKGLRAGELLRALVAGGGAADERMPVELVVRSSA